MADIGRLSSIQSKMAGRQVIIEISTSHPRVDQNDEFGVSPGVFVVNFLLKSVPSFCAISIYIYHSYYQYDDFNDTKVNLAMLEQWLQSSSVD